MKKSVRQWSAVSVLRCSCSLCDLVLCASARLAGPSFNASCTVYNASWLWDSWPIVGPSGTTKRRASAAPGSRQREAACWLAGLTLNGCRIIDIVTARPHTHTHTRTHRASILLAVDHKLASPSEPVASTTLILGVDVCTVPVVRCLGCHYIHYSAALLISRARRAFNARPLLIVIYTARRG